MGTNSLKLTLYKKKLSLLNYEVKRKNKGVNLFYNLKLNALSGLQNNQVFDKHFLKFLILKKRDNLIKHLLESQLKSFQELVINKKNAFFFYKTNYSYKALRLSSGFPIRGQRTHTNAKTARKFNKII